MLYVAVVTGLAASDVVFTAVMFGLFVGADLYCTMRASKDYTRIRPAWKQAGPVLETV